MSAHVDKQLSAYLDAELPDVERTAVEAHLAECDACTQTLAELGALDELARRSDVSAPEGYFDTLPGRVRGRLEGRRRAWRPPVWGWAAAAAILLGVLTPVTLRETPRPEEARRPEAAAPASRPPETLLGAARQDDLGDKPAPEAGVKAAAPEAREAAPQAAPPSFASEPPAARVARGPRVRVVPNESQGMEAEAAALERAPVPGPPAAASEPPRFASGKRRAQIHTAAEQSVTSDVTLTASDARAVRAQLRRALTRPQQESVHEALGTGRLAEAETDDALRVRIIELSLRAWQLEQDPDDLAQLRADAAGYLEREDAPQAEYVRDLLESATPSR